MPDSTVPTRQQRPGSGTPPRSGAGSPPNPFLPGRLGPEGAAQASQTSLRLPGNLPITAWLRIGVQLQAVADSSAWWAGDWLIHGSSVYPGRYRQAIASTRLDYQTLRNYAWVARKFEVPRRRADLSFQHHQEVAALPPDEQDGWLRRAAESGWSKAELRRQLRRQQAPGRPSARTRTRLQFELADEQWAGWQQAASREDSDVTAWLTRLADQAATMALTAAPSAALDPAAARRTAEPGTAGVPQD